jgi:hypothetical protein
MRFPASDHRHTIRSPSVCHDVFIALTPLRLVLVTFQDQSPTNCATYLDYHDNPFAGPCRGRDLRGIHRIEGDLEVLFQLARTAIALSKEFCRCFVAGSGRMVAIHVSLCQQKGTRFLGALRRARNSSDRDLRLRTYASRLVVPAPRRTGHPFAASGCEEPSQKSEFVFSASPETNRKGPRKSPSSPSRSTAGPGSLRIV